GFIRAMIGQIEQEFPIDRRRIYATGISNGAMMSYRLACDASDIFAAVGIVSGALVSRSCSPRAAVSVIHIHGTADQNVPLAGGVGAKSLTKTMLPSVQDTISFWVSANGCKGTPTKSDTSPGVRLTDFRDCRSGSEVAYYVIDRGGHSWPGG